MQCTLVRYKVSRLLHARRLYCILAGEIQALVSDVEFSQHASLRNRHVTLDDVITALRQLVLVTQCDVFGYVSIDKQLILIISAVTHSPTELQVHTVTECNNNKRPK